MLKLIRHQGRETRFEYDALGRRTAKIHRNKITRWLWDGNVPLHEWEYDEADRPHQFINELDELVWSHEESCNKEELITWIFDEGSFRPSAKLIGEKRYSIITDYLGTPVQMYDGQGELTWDADYDIYGKIRKLHVGSLSDCPFRYQGQYEDVETGLYYNRFRYYSTDSGMYVSQDPIGLAGGLPNFYGYTSDNNKYVDVFGLAHGLAAEIVRSGSTVFQNKYTSGGAPGGGRLNQQEALLTHTERKFLNEVDGMVQSGDHLKMVGELNPCKPGCQPAIRDFVSNKNVTAEYTATSTGITYSWEKLDDKHVLQTEKAGGNVTKYKYNIKTRRRKICK